MREKTKWQGLQRYKETVTDDRDNRSYDDNHNEKIKSMNKRIEAESNPEKKKRLTARRDALIKLISEK